MTLVEILVAFALGFGLLLLFYSSMSASASRFKAGESGLEANLIVQRTLEYLRKDFDGPYSLSPCNYPEKVLEELGLGTSRLAFSLLTRRVGHRISYYIDGRRTGAATAAFYTDIERSSNALAPCKVIWDRNKAKWVGPSPGGDKVFGSIRMATHPVEQILAEEGGARPRSWVIGSTLWSFDFKKGSLKRWSQESGIHEFGGGRLRLVSLLPLQEWAHQIESIPPPRVEYVSRKKTMLQVELHVERDEGRPDLVVRNILTFRN
jgi:hypothetical protein